MIQQDNNKPLFSLIVPTINRVLELRRLLDSLVTQSYKNFEVIIVDQNKDDRVERILEGYRGRLDIKYKKLDTTGASKARNAGIKLSKGDFIAFPDDDCWYPSALLERVEKFFRNNANVDGLSTRVIDENWEESAFDARKTSVKINKNNVWFTFGSVSVFLRRKVISMVGLFNENIGPGINTIIKAAEDQDFILRAIKLGSIIIFDPDYYVYHPQVKNKLLHANENKIYDYAVANAVMMRFYGFSKLRFFYLLLRNIAGFLLALFTFNYFQMKCSLFSFIGKINGFFNPRYFSFMEKGASCK